MHFLNVSVECKSLQKVTARTNIFISFYLAKAPRRAEGQGIHWVFLIRVNPPVRRTLTKNESGYGEFKIRWRLTPPALLVRIIMTLLSTQEASMKRKDAAAYLQISPSTLASWASSRKFNLPFSKVGHSARYKKSDLDAFIQNGTAP